MVLAGGEGKRLGPLTADRAKPAVTFGGHYRIVDFALSNLANAGYLKIVVLTQYKSHSLDLHITAGSADAVYQNLNLVHDEGPDYIIVFGADHIYRMDPRQMVEQHIATGAGVTVAGIRAPRSQAPQLGVIEVGDLTRLTGFKEKPAEAPGLPDSPDEIFASMGNYVFTTSMLVEAVNFDAEDQSSRHDIGGNVVPNLVEAGEAHVYDFSKNQVPGSTERDHGYWRDVGTIDSYYDAHMDLVSVHPIFNLYNREWPIYTSLPTLPPAKFVLQGVEGTGQALDSMVCAGSIISGGTVRSSVISPGVVVDSHALVENSVLMHDVVVGQGAVVRNAILDKNVQVPPGARIGLDPDLDRARFTVSDNGIVVIGKGEKVPEA
jgi:glucose-1-phosphate adenylyltransferase